MRRSVLSVLVALFAFSAFVLGSPNSGWTQDETATPEPIEGVTTTIIGTVVDESPGGVSLAVVDVSMEPDADELPFSADILQSVVEIISGTVTVEVVGGEEGETYYLRDGARFDLGLGQSAELIEGDVISSQGAELSFTTSPGDVAGLTGGLAGSQVAEHTFTNQQSEPTTLRVSLSVLTSGRCFICPLPRP
jgi:hypothetical protein